MFMKQKNMLIISLLLVLVLSITACTTQSDSLDPTSPNENNDGSDLEYNVHEHVDLNTFPTQEIDAGELEGLILMREEEKLAKDVYLTLYDLWGQKTFFNIAQSENMHTLEVKDIFDKYSLEDPVKDDSVGVFTSHELQSLYDSLVAQGSESLLAALEVGAIIEDLDIYDLDNLLSETDNEDITYVYTNLLSGSEKHIQSYLRQIEKNGGTYVPSYISQERYDAIFAAGHTGSGMKGAGEY